LKRLVIPTLAAASLALAVAGTLWGVADVTPQRAMLAVGSAVGLVDGSDVPEQERFVVLHLRLPQVLLLGLVGAALAVSGAALQATFDNPLADPGVLGISAGASLGAVLAIHTGLAGTMFLALPLAAFVGGMVAAAAVYAMSHVGGRPAGPTLLLTGVAVGGMAVAAVSLVMVVAAPFKVQELLFWLVGGVRTQTWEHLALAAWPVAFGVFGLAALHRPLDALLLGEEHASAVGVPVMRTRLLVLALTALAVGAATAVAGSIGFVGLMVPHLMRRVTGPQARALLPACVVGGAAFLTACELVSRALSERYALHLGILTALLGGPTFLVLLHRR
jgi:iron complex transport system permease protein